ncbi:hypothetical protein D3C75_774280 [compost metagenome]
MCPDDLFEPEGGFLEHGIAKIMAQRIIDGLEVIQIDEDKGNLPVAALRCANRCIELCEEERAVRQVSQRIKHGLLLKLLLGLLQGIDHPVEFMLHITELIPPSTDDADR